MSLFEEQSREIRGLMSSYEKGIIPHDEYERQLQNVSARYEKVITDDFNKRNFWTYAGAALCIALIVAMVVGMVLFSLGVF